MNTKATPSRRFAFSPVRTATTRLVNGTLRVAAFVLPLSTKIVRLSRSTLSQVSLTASTAKHVANQEACNTACKATWDKPNTLTASEIKTLDGSNRVPKKGDFNAIGQPVPLVSKQPRGYKSGESKPDADGASKPVKG